MDPEVKRKLKIVGIVATILVFLVFIFIILRISRSPTGSPYYQSGVLGSNFYFSNKNNTDSIQFFTGTAVAEFSLDDLASSKTLTNEFGLGKTQKVVWGEDAVYVKSGPLDKASPLLETKVRSGADKKFYTEKESWWKIGIKNNSISPANISGRYSIDIGDLCINGNSIYYSSTPSPMRKVIKGKVGNGFAITPETNSTNEYLIPEFIKCDEGSLVYKTGNGNLVTASESDLNGSIVAENVISAELANNEEIVISTQEESKEKDGEDHDHTHTSRLNIQVFNINDSSTRDVRKLDGQKHFVVDNKILIQFTNDSYGYDVYDISSHEFVESYDVNINKQSIDTTISIIGPIGSSSDNYAIINNAGDLSTISTNPDNQQSISPNPAFKFEDRVMPMSSGQALYDLVNNKLDVYFSSNPQNINSEIKSVTSDLRELTADLNQVRKYWIYTGEFYD